MLSIIIYIFITAFLLSFLVMPVVIHLLTKWRIMDVGGRRKIHKGFTPSMGGIGICVGFLISIMIWVPPTYWLPYRYLLFGVFIIFITGLRDDVVSLSPRGKLVMQILAAYIVVWSGGNEMNMRITSLGGFCGITELPMVVSYLLSIFVIVAITNAFNLIDGLDGLAAAIGLLAFTLLAAWFFATRSVSNTNIVFVFFLVALIGSILAFLCFNWHPASIFMGDTGSLFIGFFLSVALIKFVSINNDPAFVSEYKFHAPIAAAIVIAFLPLFDTARVFLLRISQHRSPFLPDRQHTHHLLLHIGLTHAHITILMSVLYLCFAAVIYFLLMHTPLSDNVFVPFIIVCGAASHFFLHFAVHFLMDRHRAIIHRKIVAAECY
ncbi:undecaprenyl-phosphate alpha-N-acetylglucosaminyl 1-phosphate transferase [Bacteroidia bacterium]|nr:undecaprenyl-phosphate alpha-N-acetylglucosaminyl 1-phosphate transferase [Bacteroidia bacterium]